MIDTMDDAATDLAVFADLAKIALRKVSSAAKHGNVYIVLEQDMDAVNAALRKLRCMSADLSRAIDQRRGAQR